MVSAFPDSSVTGYEPLIPVMANDPKDRHVLAAAVRGQAHALVTQNLRDFRKSPRGRTTSTCSVPTTSCWTSWIWRRRGC